MARRWSRDEAMALVEQANVERRRIVLENPPKATRDGCEWHCSACPYQTRSLEGAMSHCGEPWKARGWPCEHQLYEVRLVENKGPVRVGRRIVKGPRGVRVERRPARKGS